MKKSFTTSGPDVRAIGVLLYLIGCFCVHGLMRWMIHFIRQLARFWYWILHNVMTSVDFTLFSLKTSPITDK